ncbi:MAG: UbiA family prenyltransferase [Candidatus Thermoplasmatota archaeon]|nr:UbiA family prenyltransferase [Candidatus Thermoplasmatota archaeon]MBU1941917.1 UbiA family prenyltransferase [Candidatus Thermoplasmatota archaeon]
MNPQSSSLPWFRKPFAFITQWRPFPAYELLSYVFMFASVPMLAYGQQSYSIAMIWVIVLSIITLYSGFFAALIWNDITDIDIDSVVHPSRPIPGGRITSSRFFAVALLFSAFTFIFGVMTSIWCLGVVGFTALFVAFHNKFLKKRVRIPAYSEVFTPVQWLAVAIFGYVAIWTVIPQHFTISLDIPLLGPLSTNVYELQNMVLLVIFTYFADNAHDIPEGIHDVVGDRKAGVRTYASSFGIQRAGIIAVAMYGLAGFLGILLFFRTILSPLFLVLFIVLWLWGLRWYQKLLHLPEKDFEMVGKVVGRKGYDFFLMVYNLIFFDLCIQILNTHYGFF